MVQTSLILSCIIYSAAGMNVTLGADCKAAQNNAKCEGRAPACGANAGDCGDGWKYDKDANGGWQTASNGEHTDCESRCITGHKVVCTRCTPCVSAGVVKGKWQLKQEAQEGKTVKYKVGTKWGESHTRTETWAQEVSVSAEVGIKVEDVGSASRSVSAKISHSVVNEDKSYWEKNEEKEEDYTFKTNGDMYQWIYEIEDGCPPMKVAQTEHTLVTKKGPPCCIPGYFGDLDNPDSVEAGCREDSPNLCIPDDSSTEPPTTPEPAHGPDGCIAGFDLMHVGTAPACRGNEGDCSGDWIFLKKVKGGMQCWGDTCHDCESKCWGGDKVLCYRCKPAPPTTAAPKPATTKAPETTQEPEPQTTVAPDTTESPDPETTQAPEPETTKAPETTDTPEPETTKAPETTDTPEPETTKAPEPETTKAPEPETTKPGTTKVPEPETTRAPQPETTEAPKTTTAPETTAPPATTVQPAPYPGDKACKVCDTLCSPCQACGESQEGECEKCWHCWDYDDDELEKDDDKMDKDCDALHKDHEWSDPEVRCLTNKTPKEGDGRRRFTQRQGMVGSDGRRRTSPSAVPVDCRACWNAAPQSTETTV